MCAFVQIVLKALENFKSNDNIPFWIKYLYLSLEMFANYLLQFGTSRFEKAGHSAFSSKIIADMVQIGYLHEKNHYFQTTYPTYSFIKFHSTFYNVLFNVYSWNSIAFVLFNSMIAPIPIDFV